MPVPNVPSPSGSASLPEPDFARRDAERMRRCLELSAETPDGDVPVAAVVFGPEGREIAAATNRREADGDPLAHAEVLALRAATEALGDGWRLTECTLVVTLEPCTMCAGAAVAARIGSVVFGAWEPRTGACGSLFDVIRDRRLLWRPEVRGGVLAEEAGELMRAFFEDKR